MRLASSCLMVFTRYPTPGITKTRLIPSVGANAAAALQQRLTAHTIEVATHAAHAEGAALQVRFSGGSRAAMCEMFGGGIDYRPQGPGNEGRVIRRAILRTLMRGYRSVIAVAADVATLRTATLRSAVAALRSADVVMGPSPDGETYLIGMTRKATLLLAVHGVRAKKMLGEDLAATARRARLRIAYIETLQDVDTAADLATVPDHWLHDLGIAER